MHALVVSVCALLLLAIARALKHENLPAGMEIIELPSTRVLLDIGPSHAMKYADARDACAKIGGAPADLYDNEDLRAVSAALGGEARWIKSFNGQYFSETLPGAVYPGPAIAAPKDMGAAMLGVLCQVF